MKKTLSEKQFTPREVPAPKKKFQFGRISGLKIQKSELKFISKSLEKGLYSVENEK